MANKRIKDWATTITAFRSGDFVAVDGPNGTAKMSKDNLLKETANNALAGNVAQAFDPTRIESNSYKVGEFTIYDGLLYRFCQNHYGPWVSSHAIKSEACKASLPSILDAMTPAEALYTEHSRFDDGVGVVFDSNRISSGLFRCEPGDIIYVDADFLVNAVYFVKSDCKTKITKYMQNYSFTAPEETAYVLIQYLGYNGAGAGLNSLVRILRKNDKYKMPFSSLSGTPFEYWNHIFEMGNISMGSAARVYSDSTTRVRSKEGFEIHLKAGDVIGFFDYTDVRFYVSGSPDNKPSYTVSGWNTEDYVVPFDGWFSLLFTSRTAPEKINLDESLKNIKVIHNGVLIMSLFQLSKICRDLSLNDSAEENGIQNIDFEIGTFDRPGGKVVYSDRADRFRTASGKSVFLKSGAKIKLIDYSSYRFIVFRVDEDVYNVIDYTGWLTEDYSVETDGYYIILVDCNYVAVESIPNWENVVVFDVGGFEKQSLSQLYKKVTTVVYLNPIQEFLKNADDSVLGVNHRGYNSVAPENTLPAFRLSASNGFKWVETDIHTTLDNKLVCIHDSTVDRTSDGTGNVADMTLEQLKELDFGSWKSPDYAGTKIPTFEEFLICCKNLGLCAVVEKKSVGGDNIKKFFDTIMNCGMFGRVMVIEASHVMMDYAFSNKIMIPCGSLTGGNWTVSNGVSSNSNVERSKYWRNLGMPAFTENDYDKINADMLDYCKANDLPMAICTPNSENAIISADPYIFQVTSDLLDASVVLRENELNS